MTLHNFQINGNIYVHKVQDYKDASSVKLTYIVDAFPIKISIVMQLRS